MGQDPLQLLLVRQLVLRRTLNQLHFNFVNLLELLCLKKEQKEAYALEQFVRPADVIGVCRSVPLPLLIDGDLPT